MATNPRVWFRNGTDSWYAKINGKQVRLAKGRDNETAAHVQLAQLMVTANAARQDPTGDNNNKPLATLVAAYLDLVKPHIGSTAYRGKKRILGAFCAFCGPLTYRDVTRQHVATFVQAQTTWGPSTRRWALTQLVAFASYGAEHLGLAGNPAKGIRKPKEVCRGEEMAISDETYHRLRDNAPPWLKAVLEAIWMTGARPDEICGLTRDEYHREARLLVKKKHKNMRHGLERKIVLPEPLVALCDRQAAWVQGPFLFPNSKGTRLTPHKLWGGLTRLSARLGIRPEVVPYSLRHSFATRSLEKGIPPAHVAAMLGHRGTATLERNYSHLLARVGGLTAAADKLFPPEAS